MVRTPGGEVRVDAAGRSNGRGAYVCRDPECITIATSRGALARALTAAIPTGLAADLTAELPAGPPIEGLDTTNAGGRLGQE